MSDHFNTSQLNSAGARKAAVVTPDPANDLPNFAVRGLYVSCTAGGNVVVDPIEGVGNLTITLPIGAFHIPLQVRRVRSNTGTMTITALY
jgi:hypothetical protein